MLPPASERPEADSAVERADASKGGEASAAARAADARLLAAARERDPAATEELLERLVCVPRIVRGLNRRLGRPLESADCEDTVQAALTSIWTKLDAYRPERRLEAWIYGFCVLQLRKQLEKREREERIELRDEADGWGGTELLHLNPAFEYELVHKGLQSLSPRTARVIRLRHFEGYTFHEIARHIAIPIPSVKTLYYRGLKSLRVVLEPSYREERAR